MSNIPQSLAWTQAELNRAIEEILSEPKPALVENCSVQPQPDKRTANTWLQFKPGAAFNGKYLPTRVQWNPQTKSWSESVPF